VIPTPRWCRVSPRLGPHTSHCCALPQHVLGFRLFLVSVCFLLTAPSETEDGHGPSMAYR
jgi:hypothetical protein